MTNIISTILISILSLLGSASPSLGAPSYTPQRTILPEIADTYELGTSTRQWLNIFSKNICLNGDCKSEWPTGGTGTSDWSTSTDDTNWLTNWNSKSASTTQWTEAYSWGNHSLAGYLTSALAALTYQPIGSYLTTIAGLNISLLNNDAGYITSTPAETDPIWNSQKTGYASLSSSNVFSNGTTQTFDSVIARSIGVDYLIGGYATVTSAFKIGSSTAAVPALLEFTNTAGTDSLAYGTNGLFSFSKGLTINGNSTNTGNLIVNGTISASNLSGTNTGDQIVPSNEAGASNNFLTGYNNTTGAFTKAQPTWANINKSTSNIADITTRSHTSLTDIGTNSHASIDTALTRLANTSGTNTGDQDLSGYALKSGNLSQFALTTSLQLKTLISDETGSGALVFATSPSFTTPNIGAAIGSSIDLTGNGTFDGLVGIGDTPGTFKLKVSGSDANTFEGVNTAALGSGSGPFFQFHVTAVPSAADQRLGGFVFGVQSGPSNSAGMTAFSEQAWTLASARGTNIRFETANNGATARTEKLRIKADGDISVLVGGITDGLVFMPKDAKLNHLFAETPTSASFDGAGRWDVLRFNKDADNLADFPFTVPRTYASSLTLKARVNYKTTATTGNAIIGASIMAMTGGDAASTETDSFDTEYTATCAASTGAERPRNSTITLTNKDSMASGDIAKLRIHRDADNASDTLADDFQLLSVELYWE